MLIVRCLERQSRLTWQLDGAILIIYQRNSYFLQIKSQKLKC